MIFGTDEQYFFGTVVIQRCCTALLRAIQKCIIHKFYVGMNIVSAEFFPRERTVLCFSIY